MPAPALPGTCCAVRTASGRARLWVGPGGVAAYLGPSLQLAPHSGSVACFVLGVDGPFRLATSGGTTVVRSALVPARTVHHVVAGPGRMLFAYLEPGSARAAELARSMADRAGTVLVEHVAEAALAGRAAHVPDDDLSALIDALAPGRVTPPADVRVSRAVEIVRARPQGLTAAALAAEVGLSPSRLLHLFAAEVGTSFRRYRLWARVQLVVGALARGADLTTAAADAGFSSPSHLSDCVRRMFGLTATQLLAGRPTLVVTADAPLAVTPGRTPGARRRC